MEQVAYVANRIGAQIPQNWIEQWIFKFIVLSNFIVYKIWNPEVQTCKLDEIIVDLNKKLDKCMCIKIIIERNLFKLMFYLFVEIWYWVNVRPIMSDRLFR